MLIEQQARRLPALSSLVSKTSLSLFPLSTSIMTLVSNRKVAMLSLCYCGLTFFTFLAKFTDVLCGAVSNLRMRLIAPGATRLFQRLQHSKAPHFPPGSIGKKGAPPPFADKHVDLLDKLIGSNNVGGFII